MSKKYTALRDGATPEPRKSKIKRATSAAVKWGASLAVIAASSGMNGLLGWEMSKGAPQALAVLAVAAIVGVDWLKPFAPLAAERARKQGRHGQAAILTVAWLLAIAVSLGAAIGATALVRSQTESGLKTTQEARERAKAQERALTAKIAGVGLTAPILALEAQISAVLKHPRSEGCTKINGRYTRKWCPKVEIWRAELAAAKARAGLEAELASVRAKLEALPVVGSPDPQADRIAWAASTVLGRPVSRGDVQNALTLLIAAAIELYAAMALVITGAGSAPAAKRRRGPRKLRTDADRLAWLQARGRWENGQRELAEAWGVSIGKTNKLLKAWAKDGLVKTARGMITVL